ncbi:MAG: Ig-like domain-containing protein [Cyanobacteria bacterium P01_A01_bin.135]
MDGALLNAVVLEGNPEPEASLATGDLVTATSSSAPSPTVTARVVAAPTLTIEVEESSLFPLAGATDVNPQTPVRVEFSQAIDQSTLDGSSFRLVDDRGTSVAATLGSDLTGGVVSLTPLAPLTARTQYTLDVTSALTGLDGSPVTPFTASFTTGDRTGGAGFAFTSQPVVPGEARFGVTSVAIGPDGNAYASDITGTILRYDLDPETGLATSTETVFSSPGAQIVGLAFAPDATAGDLRLWVSYAQRGQGNFTGTISELTLPAAGAAGEIIQRDVITGLPHTPRLQHQPNGIAFGPDGRLYQNVGGLTTLGGTRNWNVDETLLSAAVIVADLNHPAFQTGEPVNVQTEGLGADNYDPTALDAPVTLFATGLRNGYDLAWHSNGNLYSGINANSLIGRFSPAGEGVPAVTARPHEMLALVQAGAYYGHPNPTRGEFVLNGGNPTPGEDPWEIDQYPVGIQPQANFDPSLIYSTRSVGGTSPNGLAEYTGFGDLNGRLLASFFTGARTIQSFELGADGRVIDTDPLTDANGDNITFSSPLDVAVHPSGVIYVANFGVSQGNPSNGGLWVLQPVTAERQAGTISFSATDYALPEGDSTAGAIALTRSGGSSGEVSVILNLTGDTAQAGEDFAAAPLTVTFVPGQTQQTVVLPLIDDGLEEGAETLGLTLSLPAGGATLGASQATVTILDDDGANAPPPAPVGGNALFVAASTRLTGAEQQFVARLEALGYVVTVQDDNDSRSSDADGQDLIVISETVISGRVGRKFTDAAVPVITSEPYLFDDLGLTGRRARADFGFERRQRSLIVTDGAHPLAGGLSGEVQIYAQPEEVSWGRPTGSAIVAAEDSQGRAAVFGYDTGATLANGRAAAARRVALPLWGTLTDDGLELFEAAVLWATGQRS